MSFQLPLEDLLRFILSRKGNIIDNLFDGELNLHDNMCGRSPLSKCFLCSSLNKYLNVKNNFLIESGAYTGYLLSKSTVLNVKPIFLNGPRYIFSDEFTNTLILSDIAENILFRDKIPCNVTFGSVCSGNGYKYTLSIGDTNLDNLCSQPDLIRPLKENKIVITSRPDTRTPLKASTVESILLNVIEIFNSLISGVNKVLLGFPTKEDLSFALISRKIFPSLPMGIDSRITSFINVPRYSSALISEISDLNTLVSTSLPLERSESKYLLQQNIIDNIDNNNDNVSERFKIRNVEKFKKLHQTGLIDFNLGMSVSFLTLLLSLCTEYPFVASLMADEILMKMWNFIWGSDSGIIESKIPDWLNMEKAPSTDEFLNQFSKVNIRKNLIPDLIDYIRQSQ